MTTETANQEEQTRAYWAQLDREDAGLAAASTEETREEPQDNGGASASETVDKDPAKAGARNDGQGQEAGEDPYAGLHPTIRDELLGLKSIVQQQAQRLRNAEGHIGGLKNSLAAAAARTEIAGGSAPSGAQITEAAKSQTAMKRLMEDYPEFGAAMKEALEESLASMPKPEQQSLPKDVITQQQLEQRFELMKIEQKHPGWQEKVTQPAFKGWLEGQPYEVQMLASSERAEHAIRLLDLHAESTGSKQMERNKRQSAAAAIPTGRQTSSVRTKSVDQMTDKELWDYLDSLDKQKA